MYCYCLFCETQKCHAVMRHMEAELGCRALYPKQVQHIRKQGKMLDLERDLMPGYVFLYAADAPVCFPAQMYSCGVIRILKNLDGTCELRDADEQFARMLLEKQGRIGKTKVYQAGQEIRICQGAFEGTRSRILKLDRRNCRMQIEIPFANQMIKTWVEYEMIASGTPEPQP